jgi:serine/threonine protein phosphatase PrpC
MGTESVRDTDEYSTTTSTQLGPPEPVSSRAEVEFGSATHPGLVRPNNQDCFLIGRAGRALETLASNLPPEEVLPRFEEVTYGMLVADGLGGGAGGEVASRLAATTLVNLVLHTPDWIMRGGDDEAKRVMDRIVERYRQIGAAVAERARDDAMLAGMATTMTLAISTGPDLYLGHVGDSRAYLLRGGELVRLTRDHTYAQELANFGLIRPDEVGTHRLRHVLTRALGSRGAEVTADVRRTHLRDGDQLLLCSDGLTGMVSDDAIRATLGAGSAQEVCEALVAAALENGGKDNVTVILARYRLPPAS